jgi:hypothetical protein
MSHIANSNASITRQISLFESKYNKIGTLVNASFSTQNASFTSFVSQNGSNFLLSLLSLNKLLNRLVIRKNFMMNLL